MRKRNYQVYDTSGNEVNGKIIIESQEVPTPDPVPAQEVPAEDPAQGIPQEAQQVVPQEPQEIGEEVAVQEVVDAAAEAEIEEIVREALDAWTEDAQDAPSEQLWTNTLTQEEIEAAVNNLFPPALQPQ